MDFNAFYTVLIIWSVAAITPGPNFFSWLRHQISDFKINK